MNYVEDPNEVFGGRWESVGVNGGNGTAPAQGVGLNANMNGFNGMTGGAVPALSSSPVLEVGVNNQPLSPAIQQLNNALQQQSQPVQNLGNNLPPNLQQSLSSIQKGFVTGGAAEVDKNLKDGSVSSIPAKTIGSNLQGLVASKAPIEGRPEREYYRIALELKNIENNESPPEWFSKGNQLTTLNRLGNKNLINFIQGQIKNAYQERGKFLNNDDLMNTNVVIAKPSSTVAQMLSRSSALKQYIVDNIGLIKSGKLSNSGRTDLLFAIPDEKNKKNIENYDDKYRLGYTFHRACVFGAQMVSEDTVELNVVDYYDFGPGGGRLNNNAYIQQENEMLKNYALIVPIRIKLY